MLRFQAGQRVVAAVDEGQPAPDARRVCLMNPRIALFSPEVDKGSRLATLQDSRQRVSPRAILSQDLHLAGTRS